MKGRNPFSKRARIIPFSSIERRRPTIRNLEEEKEQQVDQWIAELERDVIEANENTDELKGCFMAVAFGDESEGGENEGKDGREENANTSRLLK